MAFVHTDFIIIGPAYSFFVTYTTGDQTEWELMETIKGERRSHSSQEPEFPPNKSKGLAIPLSAIPLIL